MRRVEEAVWESRRSRVGVFGRAKGSRSCVLLELLVVTLFQDPLLFSQGAFGVVLMFRVASGHFRMIVGLLLRVRISHSCVYVLS